MFQTLLNCQATKKIAVLSMLLFSTLVLQACSNDEKAPSSKIEKSVVAVIGERKISVTDFTENLVKRSGGSIDHFNSAEKKRLILDEMIQREVQVMTAKKAGYDKDPAIVKALENMMVTKLREEKLKLILSGIAVSQDEINDYYQSNIAQYTTPAMSRIAIIKFSVYDTASEQKKSEVKARAEQVLELSETLPDTVKGFGSLAAKYSEDQASRYAGGDIGWIALNKPSNRIDAAVFESVATLNEKNNGSSLVTATDGYYLVKLIEQKAQQQQGLEKAERGIQNTLLRQKRKKAEASWLSSLQDDIKPIKINQSVLKSVQPPPGSIPVRVDQQPPALPEG
jgi:parvulin-like peptidyl-prolyl isomerase